MLDLRNITKEERETIEELSSTLEKIIPKYSTSIICNTFLHYICEIIEDQDNPDKIRSMIFYFIRNYRDLMENGYTEIK